MRPGNLCLAVLLLSPVTAFQSDDIDRLLERLNDESIEVREDAALKLRELGGSVIGQLESALSTTKDSEHKSRISAVIGAIKKSADLAKVFGPTRHLKSGDVGERVKDWLDELEKVGGMTFSRTHWDLERAMRVKQRTVTWWEGLDLAARSCGGRVDICLRSDGLYEFSLTRDSEDACPSIYYEQLKVSVVEARWVSVISPVIRDRMGLGVVGVYFQPGMNPSQGPDVIKIVSVKDAKGVQVLSEHPDWTRSVGREPGPLCILQEFWIKPDASSPVVVSGEIAIPFAKSTSQVVVPVVGENKAVKIGGVTISVVNVLQGKTQTAVTIQATGTKELDYARSLNTGTVAIRDKDGKVHSCKFIRSSGGHDGYSWEFSIPDVTVQPVQISLAWTTEFHSLEVPFRLEGIKVPQ